MAYRVPEYNNLAIKVTSSISDFGGGVNNGLPPLSIKENQATDMSNVSGKDYPALSGRYGKANFLAELNGTIKHLSQRENDYMMVVEDNKWKKWNGSAWEDVATLSGTGLATSIDFRGKTLLVNGTDKKAYDGTVVTDFTIKPDGINDKQADLIATHTNRVFCANTSDQYLYFSHLADYTDFSSGDTVNDGGAIEVITKDNEPATGLVAYSNHIVYFKKNSMHELYGTYSGDFSLKTLSETIGCVSNKSIAEVNGFLLFCSEDGVRIYGGGSVPYNVISEPIDEIIKNIDKTKYNQISSGSIDDKYYINFPLTDGTKVTCVYSVKERNWYIQDIENAFEYRRFDNEVYGIFDGQIKKIEDEDSDETFVWTWISKPFTENAISDKKCYNKLYLVADIPSGNTLKISLSNTIDGDDFKDVTTINPSSDYINEKINIPSSILPKTNWVRVKLTATQDVVVHYLERQSRIIKKPF